MAVLLAALVVVAACLELTGRVHPLPQRQAQVPRRWLLWRSRTRFAAAYGFMVGCGVVTFLDHAAAYGAAACVLLAPSPAAAAVVGALYGAARGGTLAMSWLVARYRRREVRWEVLIERRGLVGAVLATASMVSFAIVLCQRVSDL